MVFQIGQSKAIRNVVVNAALAGEHGLAAKGLLTRWKNPEGARTWISSNSRRGVDQTSQAPYGRIAEAHHWTWRGLYRAAIDHRRYDECRGRVSGAAEGRSGTERRGLKPAGGWPKRGAGTGGRPTASRGGVRSEARRHNAPKPPENIMDAADATWAVARRRNRLREEIAGRKSWYLVTHEDRGKTEAADPS